MKKYIMMIALAIGSVTCFQASADEAYSNEISSEFNSSYATHENDKRLSKEDLLNQQEKFDNYLDEQYQKCLSNEDCLAFLTHPVVDSSVIMGTNNLGQCLSACSGGTASIQAFCRVIPDIRVRAACWAVQFASYPACAGFCYLYY